MSKQKNRPAEATTTEATTTEAAPQQKVSKKVSKAKMIKAWIEANPSHTLETYRAHFGGQEANGKPFKDSDYTSVRQALKEPKGSKFEALQKLAEAVAVLGSEESVKYIREKADTLKKLVGLDAEVIALMVA